MYWFSLQLPLLHILIFSSADFTLHMTRTLKNSSSAVYASCVGPTLHNPAYYIFAWHAFFKLFLPLSLYRYGSYLGQKGGALLTSKTARDIELKYSILR